MKHETFIKLLFDSPNFFTHYGNDDLHIEYTDSRVVISSSEVEGIWLTFYREDVRVLEAGRL